MGSHEAEGKWKGVVVRTWTFLVVRRDLGCLAVEKEMCMGSLKTRLGDGESLKMLWKLARGSKRGHSTVEGIGRMFSLHVVSP